MADISTDLTLNYEEFIKSGDDDLSKKRFNSAITWYFKAIVVYCDLEIYKKQGLLPKNHTERFLFMKMHFTKANSLVSKIFKKYTDTYNLRMSEKDVNYFKENAKKIKELFI
tara:strand:- start:169 stop:504 length:336 start_codon:yes stop_codon:yes gene_type:complete